MVENIGSDNPEFIRQQQEIHTLKLQIEELMEEPEDSMFIMIAPEWLPPSPYGIPEIMASYEDSGLVERVRTSLKTDVMQRLKLDEAEIQRREEWDDDGSISVTEDTMLKFLENIYEYPEDIPVRELLESNGAYVLEGKLVWTVDRDEESERWWINTAQIDGHKFRILYAGYLQGRLKTLEEKA